MDTTNSNPAWRDNLSPLNVPSPLHKGKRKKVALIGFDEANIRTAPLDDPEFEIWGLNMGNRMGLHADANGKFRADRWFDLHPLEPQSVLDMAWINQCPMPLYLPYVFGDNPHAIAYPLAQIEKYYLTCHGVRPYWCSSFAYMLALAMYEGFTTIQLCGINLNWGRERVVERGNLEFWIGLAIGLGIDVVLPEGSKLLTHPARYGFEYHAEKDQVISDCAELVRQLLQQKDFKEAIDQELQDRIDALAKVRDEISAGLYRLMYISRAPLSDRLQPKGLLSLENLRQDEPLA